MKIAVLAGGTSSERAVSIVSGTKVAEALAARGHQVLLVDVFGGIPSIEGFLQAVTSGKKASGGQISNIAQLFACAPDVDACAAFMHDFDDKIEQIRGSRRAFFGPRVLELCLAADVVFMALHGSNGEDGKIQATFDLLGIPYTGSGYLGSALSMNKEISKQLFRENGVPTPAGIVLHKGDEITDSSANGVGLPCVVKPACGGSSVGVSIARTQAEYEQAVREAFAYEDALIVERYIEGREFSVGIVDGTVYPVIEIAPISGFYDYHNKYAAGSTVETCPAQVSDEVTRRIQRAALQAWNALGVDNYGRVDVMMDHDENVYCLEMNTLPGMTPTSLLPQEAAVLGMDFGQLCEKLIEVSLRGR